MQDDTPTIPLNQFRAVLLQMDMTLIDAMQSAICPEEAQGIDAARNGICEAIVKLDDAALARLEKEGR